MPASSITPAPVPSAAQPPRTGVAVRHVRSLADVVEPIADSLAAPRTDPFSSDVLVTPSKGVQRWLSQQLALRLGTSGPGHHDGIFSRVDGLGFEGLRRRLLQVPDPDPWSVEAMSWRILGVLDRLREEDGWSAVLWHHIHGPAGGGGAEDRPGRRVHVAKRIAHIFARYARWRPDILRGWSGDPEVRPVTEPAGTAGWQAELWQRIRLDVPGPDLVERHAQAVADLAERPAPDLANRVIIVAPRALADSDIELIRAARHHEVTVFVMHPALQPGAEEPHPLLTRWGDQHRIAWQQWCPDEMTDADRPATAASCMDFPRTLLGALQAAVVTGRTCPDVAVDDSVVIHGSHDPDRQVEVLRDVLCDALERNPDLQPRDIVVICTDLDTYAPHLRAAFDPGTIPLPLDHPARGIRLRIADEDRGAVNPVLHVLMRVLRMVHQRGELTEVLGLLASTPVATKFGISNQDRLVELVDQAGIRWGITERQRVEHGLSVRTNMWQTGLDRMAVGFALPHTAQSLTLGMASPLEMVRSEDLDDWGQLTEFVARLATFVESAQEPRPLQAWVELCRSIITDLTVTAGDLAWQTAHAHGVLSQLSDEGGPAVGDSGPQLSLPDLIRLLDDGPARRAPRAAYGAGHLVVCGPSALRGIPHKVVCLLGLDEGSFPKRDRPDGDDLLQLDPHPHDPSAGADGRGMLLDALMSAQDRLLLVTATRTSSTNEPRPFAVPVIDLRDALTDLLGSAAAATITRHRLRASNPENFSTDARPASFDPRAALVASRSWLPAAAPIAPAVGGFSDDLIDGRLAWSVADVVKALADPPAEYLRHQAAVTPRRQEDPPSDEIPLDLDGLQMWKIGDAMLTAVLAGSSFEEARRAAWLDGSLPPGALGNEILSKITSTVSDLHERATKPLTEPSDQHEIEVWGDFSEPVGGATGFILTGSAVSHGDAIVDVTYSKGKAKAYLDLAIRVLALATAGNAQIKGGRLIAQKYGIRVTAPAPDRARQILAGLVRLASRARIEPLPLPPRTSLRTARNENRNAAEAAWTYEKDGFQSWSLLYGTTEPWRVGQPSSFSDSPFVALARELWHPLLPLMEDR